MDKNVLTNLPLCLCRYKHKNKHPNYQNKNAYTNLPFHEPKTERVQVNKTASFVLQIFRNLSAFLIRVCNSIIKEVPTHMRQSKIPSDISSLK